MERCERRRSTRSAAFKSSAWSKPLIPMKRLAMPSEITLLPLFPASEARSYCTGSEVIADGFTAGDLFGAVGVGDP
jgi:NAD(P)-dependent dehydrogenase (short-subunit alcohol dehydrogenase family)